MIACTNGETAANFVSSVDSGESTFGDYQGLEMVWGGEPEGFIYFITIGDPYPSWVKVGFTTKDPRKRVASLQTGCPFKLNLLGFVFGNMPMEQEMHDVLKQRRGIGEWFEYCDWVKAVIADQLDGEYH